MSRCSETSEKNLPSERGHKRLKIFHYHSIRSNNKTFPIGNSPCLFHEIAFNNWKFLRVLLAKISRDILNLGHSPYVLEENTWVYRSINLQRHQILFVRKVPKNQFNLVQRVDINGTEKCSVWKKPSLRHYVERVKSNAKSSVTPVATSRNDIFQTGSSVHFSVVGTARANLSSKNSSEYFELHGMDSPSTRTNRLNCKGESEYSGMVRRTIKESAHPVQNCSHFCRWQNPNNGAFGLCVQDYWSL